MVKREHGGNVDELTRDRGVGQGELVDFSANINPLGYPEELKRKIVEDFDCILNYPDIDSHDLTLALAAYHGLDPANILVGNGSTEFMYWFPLALKPKRALIVAPAFSEYERGLQLSGTDISFFETTEEKGFAVNGKALIARLDENYDILYICNPANPTGTLIPKETVLDIIRAAEEKGTTAVIDEAFIDFVEEESVKKEVCACSRAVVLRSMTKFFGIPGLRLGYAIARADFLKTVTRDKPPWTVNALVQKAAGAALEARDYIARTCAFVREEREFLCTRLSAIPALTVFPGAANYLFVTIDEKRKLTAGELWARLLDDGIVIRDCSNYRGLSERCFRVAVKCRAENEKLINAVRKVFI